MTFFLKTLLAILVAIVIAGAIFLTNPIWFRPWSLNLFYEKAFVEVIFNEPELLTSLGLVEQFGITSYKGKLTPRFILPTKNGSTDVGIKGVAATGSADPAGIRAIAGDPFFLRLITAC